ncbi:MAG: poly-gamma-glutamate system protein, partial [Candidatus Eisenbacteria bacterium]|nr:poly-gamma-glutamate system protein [Candidatus Eisenbacteria bacterium]
TLTTTDRGVLDAKLTSVNPNFAALFVEYYRDLGLQPGDPVALAMTGSFPALNICAIVAAEELSLLPLPITSVGASMWGANDPAFSWLDMERLLYDRGLIHARSLAASLGGSNDRGRGLSPKGRDLLQEAITRNDVPLISRSTLDESIRERIAIFDREAEPRGVRAYVNIGGGSASIGTSLDGGLLRSGPNLELPEYNWTQRGALQHYGKRRVPFIHMLQIETIAQRHGFPIAPEVVPNVGEGNIFHREVYDLRIVVPSLVTYLLLAIGMLRWRRLAIQRARAREDAPAIGLVAAPDLGAASKQKGQPA